MWAELSVEVLKVSCKFYLNRSSRLVSRERTKHIRKKRGKNRKTEQLFFYQGGQIKVSARVACSSNELRAGPETERPNSGLRDHPVSVHCIQPCLCSSVLNFRFAGLDGCSDWRKVCTFATRVRHNWLTANEPMTSEMFISGPVLQCPANWLIFVQAAIKRTSIFRQTYKRNCSPSDYAWFQA